MKKTCILISTAALLCSGVAMSQTISTITGSTVTGFSGDGGPATAASTYYPWGVAMNRAGEIFFTDCTNYRVRKINTAGIISTVAGIGASGFAGDGGPATNAKFIGLAGIAADKFGNIYVSENSGQRIRKIDAAGNISTVAGTGTWGDLGDGGPATAAQVASPNEVAVDTFGNVYIPEQGTHRIQKIDLSGIITTIAGTGFPGYTGDGGAATAAKIGFPNDVVTDNAGNVYFTDYTYNVIRKINTAGIITTIAGSGTSGFSGDGGPALAATFHNLGGLYVDNIGQILVCDADNNRLRKIDVAGNISTIAGNGTAGYIGDGMAATASELNHLNKVIMDGAGSIYIADISNNRIRKITPANNAPAFEDGTTKGAAVCENMSVDISSYLAINDPDVGQTETWSAATLPAHGTLAAAYSALSTGGIIAPAGIIYTPAASYTGTDAFSIQISDGISTQVATVNVNIFPKPIVGPIVGADTICPGKKITLTNSVSGGLWSSSDTSKAKITTAGIVSGIAGGSDTILYTINVDGCIATAALPIRVKTTKECSLEVETEARVSESMDVYPNPSSGSFDVYITSAKDQTTSIIIYNVAGSKVTELTTATNTHNNISLSVPPGIYILKAITGQDISIKKIVIGAN